MSWLRLELDLASEADVAGSDHALLLLQAPRLVVGHCIAPATVRHHLSLRRHAIWSARHCGLYLKPVMVNYQL